MYLAPGLAAKAHQGMPDSAQHMRIDASELQRSNVTISDVSWTTSIVRSTTSDNIALMQTSCYFVLVFPATSLRAEAIGRHQGL